MVNWIKAWVDDTRHQDFTGKYDRDDAEVAKRKRPAVNGENSPARGTGQKRARTDSSRSNARSSDVAPVTTNGASTARPLSIQSPTTNVHVADAPAGEAPRKRAFLMPSRLRPPDQAGPAPPVETRPSPTQAPNVILSQPYRPPQPQSQPQRPPPASQYQYSAPAPPRASGFQQPTTSLPSFKKIAKVEEVPLFLPPAAPVLGGMPPFPSSAPTTTPNGYGYNYSTYGR